MKQFYFLLAGLITVATMNAQVDIELDENAPWEGFMNVFETDCTSFVFNSGWGVGDLQTVVDTKAGTITLQPNYNTYENAINSGDQGEIDFWTDGMGGGNKCMDASTLVPDNSLLGQELTFSGFVESNTLDGAYEVFAFIKVFNADFSAVKTETAELVAGQNFEVVFTDLDGEFDANVQYGFTVIGINANRDNEDALGSVVLSAPALSVEDNNLVQIEAFPNPATSSFNLKANEPIQSVAIFNILGQQVLNETPNRSNVVINVSSLQEGQYLARVATPSGVQTIKLVKR
ncbi:T9SS type A sorting domain-containing protein [Aureitalea marina]|uniref:Secretion system C-terminal sorting domain-containing protein n=1 Tax=Aureitalea marina TaxID=930804 RepID=A0A2S7KS31_9FLAO|nr:T9SS type A sorting domain-containing protein [Aureitalea marina]PQB05426.1 hypothetical protein BST85_11385 [Aureitalea marina]